MTMPMLTRKWSERDADIRFSLPTLDDSRPMNFQEQEDLVRELERSQSQQSRLWRGVFSALLTCYAAFLIYSIYQQATSPWDLRYHAYFMEDIESWMIISADWLAVLVCSLVIIGLHHNSKHRRRWFLCSCSLGTILAIIWMYYMVRLPKFRWDVLWLPFGPISGAGLSLYVDYLLTEASEDVRKLRSYMYAFKSS